MTTLAQDLGGVVRLLEKATPGEWFARRCYRYMHVRAKGDKFGDPYIMEARQRGTVRLDDDAKAIAAAVNFLRAHSAEIAGALRDAGRYRVLRMYKIGANWPREFEQAGIGAPAGLAAFGRTDPFATWYRDTIDGLMDDALGLIEKKGVRPDFKEWRAADTAETLRKAQGVIDAAMQQGGGGGDHA